MCFSEQYGTVGNVWLNVLLMINQFKFMMLSFDLIQQQCSLMFYVTLIHKYTAISGSSISVICSLKVVNTINKTTDIVGEV